MSTNASIDLRRKRREAVAQGNPELSVGDPGIKRQRKALGNPDFDFSETREGVRRIQNDSENKSKDDSNTMLAYTGGWGKILNDVFASENESPELSKKREELGIKTTQNTSSPDKEEGSKTPSNLINFIIEHEGFSSTPYDDFKQTSIGYGSKVSSKNQTVTKEEAMKLLEKDLEVASKPVLKMNEEKGYNWSKNQIDALISFTYNVGEGNFNKLTKNGTRSTEEIADMLPEYKKAGGKDLDGLIKRRAAELKLFNEGYT